MQTKLQVITFCALFWLSHYVYAQQESGSITGQVSDPSGAVVSGTQVTLRNQSTGTAFSATTDTSGFYRAPQLAPGVYAITASAAGFSTLVREGIEVRVADRLRVDLALQVGAVSETVQVKAATPLLQTEDATAGQVIDNQKITELPLNGRNWLQLATLAPGAVTYPGIVDSVLNSQAVVMNLGGNRTNQTNYLIDGADNNTFTSQGTAVVYPPVDSLQEFKVQTNNYTADTGRLGGAVVNATIKSGSNALHGTAYEFLRNRELNGRNFFATPAAPKPEFTRNQFGASAGGPVLRNQVFFFLNYEGNRQRQDSVLTRQVFAEAQKAGNFSSELGRQAGQDPLGRPVFNGQIFDPFSIQRLPNGSTIRDPFPGNVIPASRINRVSKSLIDLVPPPNSSGSPNFVRDLPAPTNIDTFVGRVDWVRSDKNTVSGHMIYSDQYAFTAPILGLPADGGNGQQDRTTNQRAAQIAWAHIFRPTDLNELRAAYLRNYSHMLPAQYDQDLNSKYGLPYPIAGPFVGGLTLLQISGFTSIGTTSTFFQIINKYELNDSYTAIRGGHVLKFGFRGASKTFYNQINCNGCRGILTFNGAYTRQPGFNATGSAVADFLTGVVSGAQLRNLANEKDVGRDLEGFAQDRWRISARLSLTLGVRYQFNPPNWEARDSFSSVLFSLADKKAEIVVPAGQRDSDFNLLKNVLFPYITVRRAPELDRNLVHNTYKNFAPRLGLAWQVDPKTVVRGGYGIFYGFTDVVSQVPTLNPPTRVLFSATANNIDPTLVIDRSAFGSNLFSRPIDSPGYNAVRDPNVHPDLTQMYNLSVQREFLSSWLLEVGFMGNRSSRVLMITQINDAVPALPSDTSSIQSRRRVSTLLGPIQYMASQGFSNYNALTVNVEKRMARGFSVLANYTWSRALGVAPALSEGINSSAIQSPVNLKREYGPLEFDIMRRLAVSYLIELPFGKGKPYLSRSPRAVDLLFGGWQLSGITTLQGGFPLTPALSSSLGKTETNSRPNAIGDPSRTSRRPDDWLSRAAFAVPTDAEVAAGNFFGNAGTGSIRAPGLVNFDFSVGKNFAIREGMRLQLRTEFFNLTNTPFFGLPGGVEVNFNSQNFGKVIAAGDPRIVQFGLKLVF